MLSYLLGTLHSQHISVYIPSGQEPHIASGYCMDNAELSSRTFRCIYKVKSRFPPTFLLRSTEFLSIREKTEENRFKNEKCIFTSIILALKRRVLGPRWWMKEKLVFKRNRWCLLGILFYFKIFIFNFKMNPYSL